MIQESEAMMASHVTQKHCDYLLIELVDSKRFEKIYKEHRNKRKDDEQGQGWLLMLSHKDIECTSDVQMIDHADGGGERKLQPMEEGGLKMLQPMDEGGLSGLHRMDAMSKAKVSRDYTAKFCLLKSILKLRCFHMNFNVRACARAPTEIGT
eukprot:SAG11_NODE_4939_length_1716_cov_3.914038_1_plen_152_part_00